MAPNSDLSPGAGTPRYATEQYNTKPSTIFVARPIKPHNVIKKSIITIVIAKSSEIDIICLTFFICRYSIYERESIQTDKLDIEELEEIKKYSTHNITNKKCLLFKMITGMWCTFDSFCN